MSRLLKSRDYLKKCLGFVLLFGFISLGAIGGCNNNGGGQDGTQALTENDFFNDPNLSANPKKGIVVVFLEPAEAPEEDNLTGVLGVDVIPYSYTRTLNHTICWEDDNVDSKHFMILQNSDGEEVLRALANGGCVTEVIEAGDYGMILTHGEHVAKIDPVFLIPIPEDEQVTKRDEFDQREFRTANGFPSKMYRYIPGGLVKFFDSISNVFTRPARAQTGGDPSANLTTLINTNACGECNLTGVNLSGKDLSGGQLGAANLTGADLFNANLSGAELNCAFLCGANLMMANLNGADLSAAFLNDELTNAQLNNCPVATVCQDDADLRGATWIDGGTCDILSLGKCNIFNGNPNPCASLTQSGDIIKCHLSTTDNSIDLVDVAQQVSSIFPMTQDTPIAILAWGGQGGEGSSGIAGGGDGGASGFASTVTSVSDFDQNYGQTSLFYYVALGGFIGNGGCGDGVASTLVMLVEKCPSCSLLDDVLLIAGGGGGGEDGGVFSSGDNGGRGGQAVANIIGINFIGAGQNGSDAQGGDGGVGGSGDSGGNGGIGGAGG